VKVAGEIADEKDFPNQRDCARRRDRVHAKVHVAMPTFQAVLPHRVIGDFLSPASFWFPERLCESAWIEHAPFAYWLMEAHRPSLLVELGTHFGYSFFAFCQAVGDLGLPTRCFAVDTWQGDDQAGRYGEEVFESVSAYNKAHYSAFAALMRVTFDGAASSFADRSIDLLHIDGRHAYEDVSHDFAVWLPKLSSRGIVVFHDVSERKPCFDVWRLWSELREKHPHFEFPHGHGLGILAVGEEIGPRLHALFDADADGTLSPQIRQAYARLGSAVTDRIERLDVGKVLELKQADLAGHVVELARVKADLADHVVELARVKADLADHVVELARMKADLAGHKVELARANADLVAHAAELARLQADLAVERSYGAKRESELEAIKHSVSWRITGPLRLAATAFGLLWRTLTSRRAKGRRRRSNESERNEG
jgi:O-antigen biosynthesis protein